MYTAWLLLLTVAVVVLAAPLARSRKRDALEVPPMPDPPAVSSEPALRRVYTVGIDMDDAFRAVAGRFFGSDELPEFPSSIGAQIEEWQTHLVVRPFPAGERPAFAIYGVPWSTSESWTLFEKSVSLRRHDGAEAKWIFVGKTGSATEHDDIEARVKLLLYHREICLILERPEPSTPELEEVRAFSSAFWPMERNKILALALDVAKLAPHRRDSPIESLLGDHYQQKQGDVHWWLFVRDGCGCHAGHFRPKRVEQVGHWRSNSAEAGNGDEDRGA